MILVDGGDFSPPATVPDKIKAQLIRDVMDRMGYDVYAVGEREINFGFDFYKSLMRGTGMEVLCGNLTHGRKKERLGKKYVVIDAGGVKVGFVHVFLQQARTGTHDALRENDYNVEDPVKEIERILPKVRKKSDFVVLLAHSPWGRLNEFLKEVSGFDLVLCAHDAGLDRKIRVLHGTKLMRPGRRGQYVVKVEMVIDPDGAVKSLKGEPLPIKTSLPEDPEIAALVRETTDKYNKMRRAQTVSHTTAESEKLKGDKYLGDAVCRRCHEDVYSAWLDTPHAAAFQALVESGREKDSDCVSCHTTGHGRPTGYIPPADGSPPGGSQGSETARVAAGSPDLKNVQCEACHGMGTYHDRSGGDFLKVGKADCSKCHTEEHSPKFDYKDYLPSVSCAEIAHSGR